MRSYRRGDYQAPEPTVGEWLVLAAMLLGAAGAVAGLVYVVIRLVP